MPHLHGFSLEGTVVAVAADRGHHFSKPPQDPSVLVEGHGIKATHTPARLSDTAILPGASPGYPISGRST
ncbi:hypothetical protein [Bradyrhizobium sp. 132]|uniref:hypothetical protein n=1 Tax=unclassified Bradyrhizobium TaxID=2631580 RepID=UPI003211EE50